MLLQTVRQVVERYDLIRPGDRGAVAFSGGPDSLTLLHLLTRLASEWDLKLHALVVDHGLRRESAQEARQAVALAQELGVDARILGGRKMGNQESGTGIGECEMTATGNVQERARKLRLHLLCQGAEALHCRWVALGHTAMDQAETVLMRAVRGTGVQGLAGMAAARAPFVRPLLGVTRTQVRRYLQQVSLRPLEDPSNATDSYFRNRLRHHVMPLLEQENPHLVRSLCRLADSCREDHQALEQLARQKLECARGDHGLDTGTLRGLLPGLLHRVLRLAHAEATGSTRRLTREHVLAMARLLRSAEGSASLDLPGVRLVREYDRLRWEDPAATTMAPGPTWELQITGPGELTLPDGRTLELWAGTAAHQGELWLSPARAPWPLSVRPPRPGDRLAVAAQKSRKVARVLMDAKIPRVARSRNPLLLCGDEVVCVVGLRVAYGYGADPGSAGIVVRLS